MVDASDLPDRLQRAGRSQSALARHLGLDPSSLTKTIRGTRRLKADEMLAIEDFFKIEASQAPRPIAPKATPGSRKIPVYGYAAAGGEDRIAVNEGRIIDWIEPPPLWSGAGDLIGVRVVGESMEPRLFAGEMVIAQAGLTPIRDRDCLVEFQDGSGLVKTFASQREGTVLCRQWNPGKEVRFAAKDVKALHAIIWRR